MGFLDVRGGANGLLAATGMVCWAFLRWLSFASRRAFCFLFFDIFFGGGPGRGEELEVWAQVSGGFAGRSLRTF